MLMTGASIKIATANAMPKAAKFSLGIVERATIALTNGPSAAMRSQVAKRGSQNFMRLPRVMVRHASRVVECYQASHALTSLIVPMPWATKVWPFEVSALRVSDHRALIIDQLPTKESLFDGERQLLPIKRRVALG